MQDLFFDTPLWILIGLAIVGIGLFVAGNNRTDLTLRNVGLAVVAGGLLLFLMSWFVDTDKEKSIRRTRQLVTAVQDRDWPTLSKLIAPRFKASIIGSSGLVYSNKNEMIDATKIAVEKFDLKKAKITSIQATDTGDYIRVNLDVYSEQGTTFGYPLISSWEFDWLDSDDGWQLSEIIALKIGGRTGEQIRDDFPRPR